MELSYVTRYLYTNNDIRFQVFLNESQTHSSDNFWLSSPNGLCGYMYAYQVIHMKKSHNIPKYLNLYNPNICVPFIKFWGEFLVNLLVFQEKQVKTLNNAVLGLDAIYVPNTIASLSSMSQLNEVRNAVSMFKNGRYQGEIK